MHVRTCSPRRPPRESKRPRALLAWVAAIVAGYLCTTAAIGDDAGFTGPLAGNWLGANGPGWVGTFAVGAGLSAALGGARIRR
ncbi:hypothetical protein OG738_38930 [Amycolatopsis sp. NBC_01488]|uniref:hypothetical protein n=1 Tax=Amycolatopsis sp. NBC_01488 TaxID=2903563 RepID=UPI002E2C0736|nr:hypothetical protein [Amycolatopsis sp. NBC_01488]